MANANFIRKNAPARATACAECGALVVQAEKGRPRRFCSDECKARVGNRAQNRRRLPVAQDAVRACVHCGKPFTPGRRDQVYCSNANTPPYCAVNAHKARKAAGEPPRQVEQIKTCVECGGQFTAFKSNAKWCSAACRIRTTGRDAARRRGPVQPDWKPYTDREIFLRDNWTCYLCGEAIDPGISRTDAEGATIDHRIPLSIGGTDAPDNVAAAHWRCNRAKGDRVRPEDLVAWIVRQHPEMVADRLTAVQDG